MKKIQIDAITKKLRKGYRPERVPRLVLISALIAPILAIALIVFANNLYIKNQTKADIELLDKAEVVMRTLEFPNADKTFYKRTCHVRSLKFADPGPPLCDVQRIDTFKFESTESSAKLADSVFQYLADRFPDTQRHENYELIKSHFDTSSMVLVRIPYFSEGLKCSTGSSVRRMNGTFGFTTICSKRFSAQPYPVE